MQKSPYGAISPGTGFSSGIGSSALFESMPMSGGGGDNIGFSVGGAKDINNFRENIKNNYFPVTTDITYEGLFYDYYFDTTGDAAPCSALFSPAYSYATTNDPISKQPEYYVSVGLNSNITEADFQRKKLNLVLVMDISGSMGSSFDKYYYDQVKDGKLPEQENRTKMQVANESLVALLDHLNPDDRVGIVLFDDVSYLAKPISTVEDTNIESIKSHILEIKEQGGTNMEAGYKEGTKLIEEYENSNKEEYENRIIFLTDAQPNTGQLDEEGLFGMAENNAEKGIYTTFIGVGVDFNTELVEAMTKVKGANYYAVHSSEDFMHRMDEGFEYMVTPLVFDLNLQFLSDDFEIEKVYGSPEANEATGQIMKVNTLFPSDNEGGEVKGGVILLKLKPKDGLSGTAQLVASYTTRSGEPQQNQVEIKVGDTVGEFYGSTGIQKAIVLTRYANLTKIWIEDERTAQDSYQDAIPRITDETGIFIPEDSDTAALSPWERQSVPLKVSPLYGGLFASFRNYFETESEVLLDESMSKEKEMLDILVKKSGYTSSSALPTKTLLMDELTYEQSLRILP
jgi:Ca-activated chloride channel family protein